MAEEDIADLMVAAWNEPYSSDHDVRGLLLTGAREIRRLRKEVSACRTFIGCLHAINESLADDLRKRRHDPNLIACVLFLGIATVAVGLGWLAFVR